MSGGFSRRWHFATAIAATTDRLEDLWPLIDKYASAVIPMELDVNDESADREIVTRVIEILGRLDVVVNAAGYDKLGPDDRAERELQRVQTNPFCALWISHAALAYMRAINLAAVYVTHGHGDHYLGLGCILERFPDAKGIATPAVIEQMTQQASMGILSLYYERRLPRQVPDRVVIPEPLEEDRFQLEGHPLVVIAAGHSDMDATTCLHVPDLDLVVAGDVAYNDVHLHLGEGDETARPSWLNALDTIGALKPKIVIAGHKRPERADDPCIIEETRQYIHDFERAVATTSTAEELYREMLGSHPDRLNRGALWSAAKAAK